MTHPVRPAVEQLEDRCVPATFGTPWADPQHLTISFVPDGTAVGSAQSNLFATLGSLYSRQVWQGEILKAFQSWAQPANIEIGLVDDTGYAIGTGTQQQGDPRFGDIRIGGFVQSSNVLATNSPPDALSATTRAGDVFLNTLYKFSVGGQAGPDLYSVFLNEAANVLGMPDVQDQTSARYGLYIGPRAGLNADDVGAVQDLYGARGPDNFEQVDKSGVIIGNESFADATTIKVPPGQASARPLAAEGAISTASDTDVYAFKMPGAKQVGADGVTIRLRTAGLSQLSGRIEVFDASFKRLAELKADGPGSDLSFQLNDVLAKSTYYVSVTGQQGQWSLGRYRLELDFRPLQVQASALDGRTLAYLAARAPEAAETMNSQVWFGPDGNSDNVPDRARELKADSGRDGRSHYQAVASLTGANDIDWFKLRSPKGSSDASYAMTAQVVALDQPADLVISVYDSRKMLVRSTTAVAADGTYTIRIDGAKQDADYFVQVRRASGGGQTDYLLAVDYDESAQNDTIATAAELKPSAGEDSEGLYNWRGILGSATDHDFYSFKSRKVGPGQPNVLVARVRSLGDDGGQPMLRIWREGPDHKFEVVPARVLINGDGNYRVEIEGVASDAKYYVEVYSDAGRRGEYALRIDFEDEATPREQVAAAFTLSSADQAVAQDLEASRSVVLRLGLSVAPSAAGGSVTMVVVGDDGEAYRAVVAAGQARTVELGLEAGLYKVYYYLTPGAPELPALDCTVWSRLLNDPIGPTPLDTTRTAAGSNLTPTTTTTSTATPTAVTTTTTTTTVTPTSTTTTRVTTTTSVTSGSTSTTASTTTTTTSPLVLRQPTLVPLSGVMVSPWLGL